MSKFSNKFQSGNVIEFYSPVTYIHPTTNTLKESFNFDNTGIEKIELDQHYKSKKIELFTDFSIIANIQKTITIGAGTFIYRKDIYITGIDFKNFNSVEYVNEYEKAERFLNESSEINISPNIFTSIENYIYAYINKHFTEMIVETVVGYTAPVDIAFSILSISSLTYQHRIKLTI